MAHDAHKYYQEYNQKRKTHEKQVFIPIATHEKVKQFAELTNQSMGSIITKAVNKYIKRLSAEGK